jgi:hypothetical protein
LAPRNQLAVWHGPAGINRKEKSPITRVIRPYPNVSIHMNKGHRGRLDSGWAGKIAMATDLEQEQPPPSWQAMHSTHVKDAIGEEGGEDVGDAHGRPEVAQPNGKLMVLVEVGKVQDHLSSSSLSISEGGSNGGQFEEMGLTSGIKPPWRIPSRLRQTKKEALPESQNWEAATMLQRVI